MQHKAARVPRYDAGEFPNLFPGFPGSVGIGVVVDRLQGQASFGHEITCYRGVDAAGEQKQALSRRSHGQTLLSPRYGAVDIGALPDLDKDRQLRMMHIHGKARHFLQYQGAQLPGQPVGIEREALVRPAGLDFKGRMTQGPALPGYSERRLGYIRHRLAAGEGAGEAHDARNTGEGALRFFFEAVRDMEKKAPGPDIHAGGALEAALDIPPQPGFELPSVSGFEFQFSGLYQVDGIHSVPQVLYRR